MPCGPDMVMGSVPAAWQVGVGLALLSVSFAATGAVGTGTALVWIGALAVLGRVGLGLTMPALGLAAMRGLAPALVPQGASAISLLRQLGGAVGVSVVGIFLEWRLRVHGDAPGVSLLGTRATLFLAAPFALPALVALPRSRDAARGR